MSQAEKPELLVISISGKPDSSYVIYKDRKVLIHPRRLKTGPFSEDAPLAYHKDLFGVLSVEEVDRFGTPAWSLRHWITSGPYDGYSSPVTIGLEMELEQLNKFFYFFYFETRDGSSWRCPTDDIDEAWSHSQPFN